MEFRSPTMDDAEAVVALLIACDLVDFGAPDYDINELVREWEDPRVDLAHDAFVSDGVYGLLLGSLARAWVHPQLRGRGLGTGIASRMEARAQERGLPFVRQQLGHANETGKALLLSRGWTVSHTYADMRLDERSVPELPTSDRVRPYDPDRDASAAQTLLEHAASEGAPRVRPLDEVLDYVPDTGLWFVADAPDGGLAGAVRAELRPAGFITGHLTQIAVPEPYRGLGIGPGLVGAVARALVGNGASLIRATVKSTNKPAQNMFEALGFTGDWYMEEFRLELRTRT